ncbi:hypothetical protein [uncultured Imperialibacter sp.]|uniref:hypothetical protein n=1 Tax=uncultured Imperialibacter sp. TaxID=1672639 RepID=UPI0030DB89B0|tara:strand:- start:114 stop:890 length:777 start_codon:yes stop_codon:yes gene_type:complete
MADRNTFTEKLTSKSDSELRRIVSSSKYVDEARLSAKRLLAERSEQVDYKPPQQPIKQKSRWIPGRHLDAEHKKRYEWRILFYGVGCLISAFYLNFESIVTTRSSLTELSGSIRNSEILIDNVSRKGRLGNEVRSRRATLIFSLNEHQKLFKLRENIGHEFSNSEYDRLSRLLLNSESVSVWISESQVDSIEPKVFQIDVNGQTILDFDSVTSKYSAVSALLLFLGLGATGFALYSKYPKRIRRLLGFDEKVADTTVK